MKENIFLKINKLIQDKKIDEAQFELSKLGSKYYKNSDIYIHLSRIESFGISIIEAMSANLPILALKAKGSDELIKENINGFFSPPQKG